MNIFAASGGFTFASLFFFIFVIVLLLAITIACIFFMIKNLDEEAKSKKKFLSIVAIITIIGIFSRILVSFLVIGDRTVLNQMTKFVQNFLRGSAIGTVYDGASSSILNIEYMPFTSYILFFFGIIAKIFKTNSLFYYFIYKLPFIISDIIIFYLLYDICKNYMKKKTAIILSSLFFINPLFIYNSTIYFSTSVFAIPALLIALKMMLDKRIVPMVIAMLCALALDDISFYVEPIFIFYLVFSFVRTLKSIRLLQNDTEKKASMKALTAMPLTLVLGTAVLYLVSLPLLLKHTSSFFAFMNIIYFHKYFIDFNGFFSLNALSIFSLFLKNGVTLTIKFPIVLFSIIYRVISYIIILFIFFSKRNRANLMIISSLVLFTMSYYFIDFRATSLLATLVLMLLSYSIIKDKRILKVFIIMSVLIFINATTSILNANYLNANNAIAILEESDLAMTKGVSFVVNIICSALALITHIYYTLVNLDVCLMGNRKLFIQEEETTISSSIKQLLF